MFKNSNVVIKMKNEAFEEQFSLTPLVEQIATLFNRKRKMGKLSKQFRPIFIDNTKFVSHLIFTHRTLSVIRYGCSQTPWLGLWTVSK